MFGERLASASIGAAQDSIDLLSGLSGSDETSFSLAAFGQLVRREWNDPVLAEHLPEKRYSLPAMMQALAAWAAIQNVTHFHTEIQWFQSIREFQPQDLKDDTSSATAFNRDVQVIEDTVLPEDGGQIISAEIGEASDQSPSKPFSRQQPLNTMKRLLKLVLAGHGGAGMIFFGLPLKYSPDKGAADGVVNVEAMRSEEEALVKDVAGSMEKDINKIDSVSEAEAKANHNFSWWNVLMGNIHPRYAEHDLRVSR